MAAKEHALIQEVLDKYVAEPVKKKTGERTWTLNSRNLIAAVIFGKFRLPIPRGFKDKIPSTAAGILEKLHHPFCDLLIRYRSKAHTVTSIESSLNFIRDAYRFNHKAADPEERRAIIVYNIVNYGNVERIFTPPKESIAISADKRIRYALRGSNHGVIPTASIPAASLSMLPSDELMDSGEQIV